MDACRMSDRDGREVEVAVADEKDNLVFSVCDNGIGMDCDIKSKVFTTFFTTKGGEGTGLGLLTTRKIVKEHGGDITVSSKSGQGSEFRVVLPRRRLEALYADTESEQ
jgi:signal transduction histidine kinase